MPMSVVQVTLGAAATVIATGTGGQPFQELRLNPAAHDYYIGGADVSTTKYFAKVLTAGATAQIIGNGPAGIKIDDLRNLYLLGTQSDVVNLGVVTL